MPTSVELWLPESIAGDAGLLPARPDGVVVLQRARLSAVVCLEIDEASEHAPQIRAKLDTWATVFAARPELVLLFVVPTESRLAWLRRNAGAGRRPALEGRSFGVVAGDLASAGLEAPRSHPSAGAANAGRWPRSSPSLGLGAPGLQLARPPGSSCSAREAARTSIECCSTSDGERDDA